MRLGIRQGMLDSIGLPFQFQEYGMLQLPAGAAMKEDELLRDQACHITAQILFDHRQRQIGAGAHSP